MIAVLGADSGKRRRLFRIRNKANNQRIICLTYAISYGNYVFVCYITQTRPANVPSAVSRQPSAISPQPSAISHQSPPHPLGISGDFTPIPWGLSGDSLGIYPAN